MNDNSSGPVKIELSANATLEVKAEVPSASAGRLVDALTDLVRPWSEARGLKADLIRLQREEVALKIAQRAAHRIGVENAAIEPIPLKVLVPLLEHGSNERIDDDYMIDRWAELLVSATEQGSISPRFVSLLSELNGRQAELLTNLYQGGNARSMESVHSHEHFIAETMGAKDIADACSFSSTPFEERRRRFAAVGVRLVNQGWINKDAEKDNKPRAVYPLTQPAVDVAVLQSLGLISIHRLRYDVYGPTIVQWDYYGLTNLGIQLVRFTDPSAAAVRTPTPPDPRS